MAALAVRDMHGNIIRSRPRRAALDMRLAAACPDQALAQFSDGMGIDAVVDGEKNGVVARPRTIRLSKIP